MEIRMGLISPLVRTLPEKNKTKNNNHLTTVCVYYIFFNLWVTSKTNFHRLVTANIVSLKQYVQSFTASPPPRNKILRRRVYIYAERCSYLVSWTNLSAVP